MEKFPIKTKKTGIIKKHIKISYKIVCENEEFQFGKILFKWQFI